MSSVKFVILRFVVSVRASLWFGTVNIIVYCISIYLVHGYNKLDFMR